MIETLPSIDIPGHRSSGLGGPDHPMRRMTRVVAGLDPGEWDEGAERQVALVFDELAPDWHTRDSPERTKVVEDALRRGLDPLHQGSGMALEVGSGIGSYTSLIAGRFDLTISLDLAWEMLVRAPRRSARVLGDGGRLPLRDDSLDAFVLINAFLFPLEVSRTLRRRGVVLWVNTSGEGTPIHLSTAEVVAALPFDVAGLESRAGAGTWCALVRD